MSELMLCTGFLVQEKDSEKCCAHPTWIPYDEIPQYLRDWVHKGVYVKMNKEARCGYLLAIMYRYFA